jgi:peptide/nickel transport system permease protein
VLRLVPLGLLTLVSALTCWLYRASPSRLEPSRAWESPSWGSPFGCGEAGVDLFALVAHAEVRALALAVVVALFGLVVGTPLGAGAALLRGYSERAVGRACDLIQAFPTFLLALAVLSAVRVPTRTHLGVVFALTAWAPFARLALSQARVLREAAFVEASSALGAGHFAILLRHIVPNLFGVVGVQLGASGAAVVVSEASLAFVGLGPRDGVSLGGVMDQGVAAMLRAPHVLVVGAVAVFLTSGALLAAGRALGARGA